MVDKVIVPRDSDYDTVSEMADWVATMKEGKAWNADRAVPHLSEEAGCICEE